MFISGHPKQRKSPQIFLRPIKVVVVFFFQYNQSNIIVIIAEHRVQLEFGILYVMHDSLKITVL